MFKAIETENVIKNIVREIVRECGAKSIQISDACAGFMIKLMFLNPQHGFISDRLLSREDVQILIRLCVEKLSEKNSSSLATIKMQVYFDTNYAPREEIISKNCETIKTRTAPLIKEIIETTAKTKEDLEKLYRKIVVAVIISSGLGNPTNIGVLKESTAALQSVFPPSELGQFMALSRKDKDQQIMELTHIVTGIRLFNRDCQKGGEGIDDLPNVLQQTITVTHSNLQTSLQKLMENVDTLTTALDLGWRHLSYPPAFAPCAPPSSPHTTLDLGEDTSSEEDETEEHVKNELNWDDVERVRDMLITGRQQEVYLRKLLSEVELSRCSLDELLVRLKKRLLQIHDTVRFRTAIPTIQVYPQFIDLSEIWTGFQNEMVLLNNINNILWNLHSYTEVMDHTDNEVLKMMLGDAEVLTDADRLEASMGQTIHRRKTINCGVVDPSVVADFDRIPLQYLGFCAWTFVEGRGALIPANQNMGVLRWNGNYYAFSSPDAAYQFDQDPEKYIKAAANLARVHPELINLLQLHEQMVASRSLGELPSRLPEPLMKRDIEMQTELHPIPSYIDPNYTWNEWELKRKAIQLANICKSKTHSTQTNNSHKRASIGVQAQQPKDVGCQTKRDMSTNVPKLQNFIFGLRGRKENIQHVISLTRPTHE